MRLVLSARAAAFLRYAAEEDPHMEISGFGRTTVLPNDDIYVDDIILPPQEVGAGHVKIDVDGLDVAMQYVMTEKGESLGQWRMWWHSHGSGGAFASGTDKDTLAMLAEYMGGWALGHVITSKEDRYTWLSVAQPFHFEFEPKHITEGYTSKSLRERVQEAFKGVRKRSYQYNNYTANTSRLPEDAPDYVSDNFQSGWNWVRTDYGWSAYVKPGNEAAFKTWAEENERVWRNGHWVPKAQDDGKGVRKSLTDMTDAEFAEWVR